MPISVDCLQGTVGRFIEIQRNCPDLSIGEMEIVVVDIGTISILQFRNSTYHP